jgi:hypothetical protein
MTRRSILCVPGAVLAAALLLAGCSASTADSGADGEGGFAPGLPAAPMPDAGGGDSDGPGAEEDGDGIVQPGPGRSVVTTGWMYLTVEAPLAAVTDATTIVERAGGRVDARSEYAPQGSDAGGAELVLRIPSDRLSQTIDDLKELGELEELSLTASDVTRQVQDLDARIGALESSLTRLLALLGQADDIDDLITLESVVADRQGQLESLQAQQRSLADQVSLSTLTLTLGSESVAPPSEARTFLDGLSQGWEALVAFGSGALVVTGVLIPWLLAVALLGLVILVSVRAERRRRARRAQIAADAPAPLP